VGFFGWGGVGLGGKVGGGGGFFLDLGGGGGVCGIG